MSFSCPTYLLSAFLLPIFKFAFIHSKSTQIHSKHHLKLILILIHLSHFWIIHCINHGWVLVSFSWVCHCPSNFLIELGNMWICDLVNPHKSSHSSPPHILINKYTPPHIWTLHSNEKCNVQPCFLSSQAFYGFLDKPSLHTFSYDLFWFATFASASLLWSPSFC